MYAQPVQAADFPCKLHQTPIIEFLDALVFQLHSSSFLQTMLLSDGAIIGPLSKLSDPTLLQGVDESLF